MKRRLQRERGVRLTVTVQPDVAAMVAEAAKRAGYDQSGWLRAVIGRALGAHEPEPDPAGGWSMRSRDGSVTCYASTEEAVRAEMRDAIGSLDAELLAGW